MTHGEWTTSTVCSAGGCVAVRIVGEWIEVADTKRLAGPRLSFTVREWIDFVAGVRAGQFDVEEAS